MEKMRFLIYLVITLFSQVIFFKILWTNLVKELMEFENRIDEKINLFDKLSQLENDQDDSMNRR